MFIKKFLFASLMSGLLCTMSFASVRDGHIINLNPSVRAAGMGYAYTANSIDDAFGIFSNPAFKSDYPITGIMYSTVFNDGESLSEYSSGAFAFLYPELFFGINVGAGAVSSFEGNLGNSQDLALYLNFSKEIGFLRIGANVKYIDSAFYRSTDSDSYTADFGLLAAFGILNIGVSGFNLAGDFNDSFGDKINPSLGAGASLNFTAGESMFIFEIDGFQENLNEEKIMPRAGFEFFHKFFAVRLGYEYNEDLSERNVGSAGFGLDINNIIFDYAFITADSRLGSWHKIALSYRFVITPRVNNEQFKQQVKYEKQQAKIKAKAEKKAAQQRNEKKRAPSSKKSRTAEKKESKNAPLPLQPVNYNEDEYEFVAVLAPVDLETAVSSRLSASKDEQTAVYQPTGINNDDFDAALYLLQLERVSNDSLAKTSSSEKKHAATITNPYVYAPTPHNKGDYDPALELLAKSDANTKKEQYKSVKKTDSVPELKIVKDDDNKKAKKTPKSASSKTEKSRNKEDIKKEKEKTASAKDKKKKRKEQKASKTAAHENDDEFDAARYILENPGQSKIKQYYVKPTEHKKDEFDPALYLIQIEKTEKDN